MNMLITALSSEKANAIMMCHIAVLPVRKIKAKKKITEKVKENRNFLLFGKAICSFLRALLLVMSCGA
jgi:hypothetical protein